MMLGPLCVLLALQVGAVTLADVPNDELAKGDNFRRPSAYRSRAPDRHPSTEGRGLDPPLRGRRPPPPRYSKPPAEWVASHRASPAGASAGKLPSLAAGASAGKVSRSEPPPPPPPPPVYPDDFVGNYSGKTRVVFGQFPKVTQLVGPKMHKTGSTTFGAILARLSNQCGRGGLVRRGGLPD